MDLKNSKKKSSATRRKLSSEDSEIAKKQDTLENQDKGEAFISKPFSSEIPIVLSKTVGPGKLRGRKIKNLEDCKVTFCPSDKNSLLNNLGDKDLFSKENRVLESLQPVVQLTDIYHSGTALTDLQVCQNEMSSSTALNNSSQKQRKLQVCPNKEEPKKEYRIVLNNSRFLRSKRNRNLCIKKKNRNEINSLDEKDVLYIFSQHVARHASKINIEDISTFNKKSKFFKRVFADTKLGNTQRNKEILYRFWRTNRSEIAKTVRCLKLKKLLPEQVRVVTDRDSTKDIFSSIDSSNVAKFIVKSIIQNLQNIDFQSSDNIYTKCALHFVKDKSSAHRFYSMWQSNEFKADICDELCDEIFDCMFNHSPGKRTKRKFSSFGDENAASNHDSDINHHTENEINDKISDTENLDQELNNGTISEYHSNRKHLCSDERIINSIGECNSNAKEYLKMNNGLKEIDPSPNNIEECPSEDSDLNFNVKNSDLLSDLDRIENIPGNPLLTIKSGPFCHVDSDVTEIGHSLVNYENTRKDLILPREPSTKMVIRNCSCSNNKADNNCSLDSEKTIVNQSVETDFSTSLEANSVNGMTDVFIEKNKNVTCRCSTYEEMETHFDSQKNVKVYYNKRKMIDSEVNNFERPFIEPNEKTSQTDSVSDENVNKSVSVEIRGCKRKNQLQNCTVTKKQRGFSPLSDSSEKNCDTINIGNTFSMSSSNLTVNFPSISKQKFSQPEISPFRKSPVPSTFNWDVLVEISKVIPLKVEDRNDTANMDEYSIHEINVLNPSNLPSSEALRDSTVESAVSESHGYSDIKLCNYFSLSFPPDSYFGQDTVDLCSSNKDSEKDLIKLKPPSEVITELYPTSFESFSPSDTNSAQKSSSENNDKMKTKSVAVETNFSEMGTVFSQHVLDGNSRGNVAVINKQPIIQFFNELISNYPNGLVKNHNLYQSGNFAVTRINKYVVRSRDFCQFDNGTVTANFLNGAVQSIISSFNKNQVCLSIESHLVQDIFLGDWNVPPHLTPVLGSYEMIIFPGYFNGWFVIFADVRTKALLCYIPMKNLISQSIFNKFKKFVTDRLAKKKDKLSPENWKLVDFPISDSILQELSGIQVLQSIDEFMKNYGLLWGTSFNVPKFKSRIKHIMFKYSQSVLCMCLFCGLTVESDKLKCDLCNRLFHVRCVDLKNMKYGVYTCPICVKSSSCIV